jgi:hypothetical protein
MTRKPSRNYSRGTVFYHSIAPPTRKVRLSQVKIDITPQWQKSSYCGTNACVEVAQTSDAILVRDSKNPLAMPLAFTTDEWTAFVKGVKAGEFN